MLSQSQSKPQPQPQSRTSMSEEDAAYSALLAQLLSDSSTNRNARVHSWIEHQYDFALSEHSDFPFASSRPPSPSPSSSLGAHRACSVDRPDSPLLPRLSSDRTSSPCPSYDALFFPQPDISTADDPDFEELERLRALRFIVQEMAHWKSDAVPPSPPVYDKPLPAPPPSPASSVTQSTSSRAMRSRSSSTCISRLPSFTSTLSSDQSQPQEIPPPLPVSVIVHGEFQHDLVLRHERPILDAYLHKRGDSCPMHSHDQDVQLLPPILDDKDSIQPSPTFSNFSCTLSRETSFTTPYASSPTSPTSAVFSACCPEDIALPASPLDDRPMFKELIHEPTSPVRKTAFPYSPSHASLPVANILSVATASQTLEAPTAQPDQNQCLRAPELIRTQSRWSVATTASLTPSTADRKSSTLLSPKSIREKKDKSLKAPKKRARFISLISRFSPGRSDVSSATTTRVADEAEYDSANDSDAEDKEKTKPRKSLSKKSSLASLRASFSLSRASFSSQRPVMSSSFEEVPPLPTSPTLMSSLAADNAMPVEISIFPKPPLSRISSRANLLTGSLPPIPQSASTVTTFQSASQLSISDMSAASASESRSSLACPLATPNASRISLLPASSKRTSLASAAGVDPMLSTSSAPAASVAPRSKSIFRLTTKPKSIKAPMMSTTKGTAATLSRLPYASHASLPSPTTAQSRIPQAPTKFTPPAKLANVIATQSRKIPALASTGPGTHTSKLPVLPARIPPKIPRAITTLEKPPTEVVASVPPSSRLPMPASTKGTRVGTVRGFWKRQ